MTDARLEIPFSTSRYENRAVLFIDLIGFSDFVMQNRGDRVQVVTDLTKAFQDLVHDGAKYVLPTGGTSFRPAVTFFSDSIIVAVPLNLYAFEEAEEHMRGGNLDKAMLLFICSGLGTKIQLHALKHGILTRGCLTVGEVYHSASTWFGPAIIEAHRYESTVAVHPRIVLSQSAVDYFQDELNSMETKLCVEDEDGHLFLDYIAWIHTKLGDDFCAAHHRMREIIVGGIDNLRISMNGDVPKDDRRLQKWHWLASYFNKMTDTLMVKNGGHLADRIDL